MITSRSNQKIKQIRKLGQRKAREASGRFVVEGIAHVAAAVEAGAAVDYICYAPELLTSPFARDLLEREMARGMSCHPVAADVFAAVSGKDNPAGILAVVAQPQRPLAELTAATFSFGVALVSPQDPGNIGTILRTIDAVGADGLLLLDGGADAYHPSAVRASMGALLYKQVAAATFAEFAQWARRHGYRVVGTSAHARSDYRTADYARPLLLLMGSEQEGLTPEQMALCDETVRLPMHGRVTSLNLAIATGVMLYEAIR